MTNLFKHNDKFKLQSKLIKSKVNNAFFWIGDTVFVFQCEEN
jgi:hypothetical protein